MSEGTLLQTERTAWVMASPIGDLTLVVSGNALTEIRFGNDVPAGATIDESKSSLVVRQLKEYFAGLRKEFDVCLEPKGTAFQQSVWRLLLTIPYGETRAYSDLANALGQPNATRAVGAANGQNPIPIIVPCHRVIGRSGKLTGFAGRLPMKRYLLDLETFGVPSE
jgi:methylated-DNA-[protein]-cysteine S-methyltransferase